MKLWNYFLDLLKRGISSRFFYWTNLSKAGRNRTIRTSFFWFFFVPLMAKVLNKIGPQILIPLGESNIIITLGLPFSWKLFYLSSLFFSVGLLLYSMKCPEIIRDYQRFYDFEKEGKGDREIIHALIYGFAPSASMNYRAGRIAAIREFTKLFCDRESNKMKVEAILNLKISEEMKQDAFFYVWAALDTRTPVSRILCRLFLTLGFGTLLIVIGENIMYVWKFVV